MWLFSGKVLPVIVLIGIPAIAIVSLFVIPQPVIYYLPALGYIFYPAALLYIIIFVYGFYPIKYYNDKFFKKRGYKCAIIEYIYVKKILYVIIPMFIIGFTIERILIFLYGPFGIFYFAGNIRDPYLWYFFYYYLTLAGPNLAYPVIGGVIWFVLHISRKEFRFYFAKTIFELSSKEKEETKKAKYLIEGLKFYDRYLQRNLDLQINDIKMIYSKLIIDPKVDKNETIQSLSASFENGNDKLKPAKCLSEIVNIQETGKFLIDKSMGQRIKDSAIFFATIIPVVIAIIQLLFPAK